MTSTYADVYFKASIKDGAGNPTEPPEDVYAQLTSLIESGILKGDDGLTPYVGSNNNWWIGDIDTGVLARGTDGEDGYTPVKGMDYFTEEEIQQIQNEVSGGAIGDFKAVVDEETATFNANAENTLTGYNANAQEKFDTYNANADSKFETYNTNAETKFSGYNTNAEAKLSEYNKNDLDKTTSYNTNADSKFTKYNTNAEAKFSEYTNNADTKLAEYNQNDSDKTDLYNTNAESKLGAYDSNAQAKLDLYNQNDSEKTEAYNNNAQTKLAKYNANASEKLTTYDTNAEQHTSDYNRNAEVKLESYNQNHAAKVAEYNQNAETKTAEFDANAAALQTEVDRLRGECDQLAAENRKQENRIDALIKLNKGQTYDVLEQESEAYSVDVPSGAKYVGIDKVGGKSVVWNQLFNLIQNNSVNGGQFEINFESQTVTLNGNSGNNAWLSIIPDDDDFSALNVKNHQYIYKIAVLENQNAEDIRFGFLNRGFVANIPANYTGQVNFVCTVSDPDKGKSIGFSGLQPNTDYNVRIMVSAYDLTLMFGAGTEPTAEQFEQMFPAESYPYNPGEIISSRTETITAGVETITTGFPELKSAGTAHDEIDMDGGEIRRSVGVVDLGTLTWETDISNRFRAQLSGIKNPTTASERQDGLVCARYLPSSSVSLTDITNKGMLKYNGEIFIKDTAYTDETAFKEAMSGVMLYYELAEPVITDIDIPTKLTDWLEVEAGGTVTFRNADETKQLAVPNAVSWVRKLDEVN